jgi:signal transduction histidine kinase
MTLFRSLTNRIFLASALLAVLSIAAAIYIVNVAVTAQAEQELLRGLDEAGTLVEEYRQLTFDHIIREARLVADLPRFKAAVSENDAPTVRPVAEEYQQQLGAHLFVVTGRTGSVLAEIAAEAAEALPPESLPGIRTASTGREAMSFSPHPGGILQVVSVPVWIDPRQPQILGTLSVGFSLDNRAAGRFRALTNSEIAFGVDGAIQASTLPERLWPSFAPLLARPGLTERITVGGDEYVAVTTVLSIAGQLAAPRGAAAAGSPRGGEAMAIILRSRTERLKFLNTLHQVFGVMALVAVLAATLLSYAIARTVTRPLGTITATMREMAATGDLTRRITLRAGARWEDEDARLLATTFNSLTDSIARFQREVAQRERLSSLGRLSTVVAHEIRNPLMIIKTALRSLRRDGVDPAQVRAAVADIDEEIARLNHIVTEVLDFARPIRFELAPADLNALCEDAVRATAADAAGISVQLDLDPELPAVVTDAERLRLALVNILTNARRAVSARTDTVASADAIRLTTGLTADRRVTIQVRDRGVGIPAGDLPRVFEPFFTTRRTGTGLGLAISRNIVEGLGGALAVSSEPGAGTEVRIELPLQER